VPVIGPGNTAAAAAASRLVRPANRQTSAVDGPRVLPLCPVDWFDQLESRSVNALDEKRA